MMSVQQIEIELCVCGRCGPMTSWRHDNSSDTTPHHTHIAHFPCVQMYDLNFRCKPSEQSPALIRCTAITQSCACVYCNVVGYFIFWLRDMNAAQQQQDPQKFNGFFVCLLNGLSVAPDIGAVCLHWISGFWFSNINNHNFNYFWLNAIAMFGLKDFNVPDSYKFEEFQPSFWHTKCNETFCFFFVGFVSMFVCSSNWELMSVMSLLVRLSCCHQLMRSVVCANVRVPDILILTRCDFCIRLQTHAFISQWSMGSEINQCHRNVLMCLISLYCTTLPAYLPILWWNRMVLCDTESVSIGNFLHFAHEKKTLNNKQVWNDRETAGGNKRKTHCLRWLQIKHVGKYDY